MVDFAEKHGIEQLKEYAKQAEKILVKTLEKTDKDWKNSSYMLYPFVKIVDFELAVSSLIKDLRSDDVKNVKEGLAISGVLIKRFYEVIKNDK